MAFKGQEHLAFIKTSFNYDVDELCDSYLAEKWQTRKHLTQVIENKSARGRRGHRCVSLPRVIHCRIFNPSSSAGEVSEQIVVHLERGPQHSRSQRGSVQIHCSDIHAVTLSLL